jgi:putrescine transport system ATP-binding protein
MTTAGQRPVFAPWDDPDAKPLIEFRGVTKRFGQFTAVDGIDLDIFPREFFALLGPSGCGKTTLMRMLAGFEDATEGAILLDGKDLSKVPANRRPVNMMFQSYALFPHLSVADNIAFGLKRSDMPKSEIAGRVDEMLKLVQLGKFAKRKPHQISGGQRQRVALARALAKAPKLLLLDEPLAALDKKLRQDTQFELMGIQEKLGTTFVIVTHDQEEAMTVASRVAVMDQGRLMQVDTPDRIYEYPNSAYVADFIGEVNLIRGRAAPKGDLAELDWAEGAAPLSGAMRAPLGKGDAAVLAIRPEKVTISADKPKTAENVVQGRIEDIAYLGNVSTYHVELPSGHTIRAQTANTHRISGRVHTWDDEVWLCWPASEALILPE